MVHQRRSCGIAPVWRSRAAVGCGLIVAAALAVTSIAADEAAPEVDDTPATSGISITGVMPPDARPTLTGDEYAKLAAELRIAYAKPPAEWPAPDLEPGVKHDELGLLPPVEHPKDNPHSREKVALGKKLFFDPRLSGSGQFSCASCHNPELGWTDGSQQSFGHDRQRTKRNTPSIMGTGYATTLFWDGRATSLEDQATGPITQSEEMNGSLEAVEKAVNTDPAYKKAFADVFKVDEVTIKEVTQALATFERSVNGGDSGFDRFLRGRKNSMSDAAVRGLHVFRTTGGCLNCHSGPNFSDNLFHDNGISNYGSRAQDLGRYEVTKNPKDVGAFRTMSLRNIERTGPYMHSGFFELDEVLRLYNKGMFVIKRRDKEKDDPLFPTKSPLLKPRKMNRQDLDDLKAFLFSLTEPKEFPPRN
jgi:cytochrome c peroxidase